MSVLQRLDDGIWAARYRPHRYFGLHLGTRMTVVRLSSGGVLIHSAVEIDETLQREIDAIGPVQVIIAPNLFHHVYAGKAAQLYPEAKVYVAPGLGKKRPDLRVDGELSDVAEATWAADLEQVFIPRTLLLETVFFHRASKTLISSDLIEGFMEMDHAPTRFYLKLNKVFGRYSVPPIIRICYRDKNAAREALNRVLQWPFDRAVIAHGDIIEKDAKEILRQCYSWLGVS